MTDTATITVTAASTAVQDIAVVTYDGGVEIIATDRAGLGCRVEVRITAAMLDDLARAVRARQTEETDGEPLCGLCDCEPRAAGEDYCAACLATTDDYCRQFYPDDRVTLAPEGK